jgi:hypothetical protein
VRVDVADRLILGDRAPRAANVGDVGFGRMQECARLKRASNLPIGHGNALQASGLTRIRGYVVTVSDPATREGYVRHTWKAAEK